MYVRARYDDPDASEASRCVTTEHIEDDDVALAAAEGLAKQSTTDVIVIAVRGDVAEVFALKGVEWCAHALLNEHFPGWRMGDPSSLRTVLQFPDGDLRIHSVHRLMSWTDEGMPECVEAVIRRRAEPSAEEDAPAPTAPPVAA
jgi:hypothetical protein